MGEKAMRLIQVLGVGCPKCEKLKKNAEQAIQELGVTREDLKALNRTALDHAFYPDKKELKRKLAHLWD